MQNFDNKRIFNFLIEVKMEFYQREREREEYEED